MNRKFVFLITLVSAAAVVFVLPGCQKATPKAPVACTEEAKVCPDGSAVGRTGPNCSFAPCPEVEAPVAPPEAPKPPVEPPVIPVEIPKPPVNVPKPSEGASGKTAEFGKPIAMRVNGTVVFSDGLSLTLKEVNDSRCPAGVQCIWQGELSPLLIATANGSSDEVRLGTVRAAAVSVKGYTYKLVDATETTATVQVSVDLLPFDS